MPKVGIYVADHHHFVTENTHLAQVQEECREHLKPNNHYARVPSSSVIHYHKQNVAACTGYNHEEYHLPGQSTSVNADKAAAKLHTPR